MCTPSERCSHWPFIVGAPVTTISINRFFFPRIFQVSHLIYFALHHFNIGKVITCTNNTCPGWILNKWCITHSLNGFGQMLYVRRPYDTGRLSRSFTEESSKHIFSTLYVYHKLIVSTAKFVLR